MVTCWRIPTVWETGAYLHTYSNNLLYLSAADEVRQPTAYTVEPSVLEPRVHEFQTAIQEMKSHTFQVRNIILAEQLQAGGSTLHSEIQELVLSI
jgi:hypothetical protein